MMERKVTSIRIDPDLWRELKKVAIDLDMKVYEVLEQAIREFLKQKQKEVTKRNEL